MLLLPEGPQGSFAVANPRLKVLTYWWAFPETARVLIGGQWIDFIVTRPDLDVNSHSS
jgi:hypothetical protein